MCDSPFPIRPYSHLFAVLRVSSDRLVYGKGVFRDVVIQNGIITPDDGMFLQLCGYDGHLSYGTLVRTTVGLRVALRLDVSQIQVVSGSGTIWDPCRLALVSDGTVATPPIHDERPTPVPTTPKPRSGKNRKKSDPTPAPEAATPVPTPEWIGDYAQESGW